MNQAQDLELVPIRPWVFKASDPSIDLELTFTVGGQGDVLRALGKRGGVPFTLEPFLKHSLCADELAEYVGANTSQKSARHG